MTSAFLWMGKSSIEKMGQSVHKRFYSNSNNATGVISGCFPMFPISPAGKPTVILRSSVLSYYSIVGGTIDEPVFYLAQVTAKGFLQSLMSGVACSFYTSGGNVTLANYTNPRVQNFDPASKYNNEFFTVAGPAPNALTMAQRFTQYRPVWGANMLTGAISHGFMGDISFPWDGSSDSVVIAPGFFADIGPDAGYLPGLINFHGSFSCGSVDYV